MLIHAQIMPIWFPHTGPLPPSPHPTQLLESWTFVANFAAALRPACDLGLLIHYAPKIRSLAAAVLEQGAAGKGEATDCLASCPDVLHVSGVGCGGTWKRIRGA